MTFISFKRVRNLQSQSFFRISTARGRSSLNEADIKTFSWLDAICLNSAASAPLPTPTAYTATPLFFTLCEATDSSVYALVVVCFPSVMTINT